MKSTKLRWTRAARATRAIASTSRWAVALAAVASASCAIEGSKACGPHQVYAEGSGLLDYAVCVCDEADGYVFDVARGHGCKRCPDDEPIVDGKCGGGVPDGDAGPDRTEPTGVGEPCETSADCTAFDAKFCAPTMGSCLVDNCASGENWCGSQATCCDFSHLMSGVSMCIPAEYLESGDCPFSGMKVEQ